MYLTSLAVSLLVHYKLTDENKDLEESISLSVEIILSFDPHIRHGSDFVTAFFFLADSLFCHLQKLKRLDDSKLCVRYYHYLRDQSLETSHITRGHVTTVFTYALAIQVKMESINPMQNIEEMATLCHKLLSLDASDELLLSAAEALIEAICDRPLVGPPLPDQAIEFLCEANIHFPDSDSVSLGPLYTLTYRFRVI